MDALSREMVRKRAGFRCEYCRLPELFALNPFHLDHVIPVFHRGTDGVENRALACAPCNPRKGTNLAGTDPNTGKLSELFNPRLHSWPDRFQCVAGHIVGLTAIGRTTV